ncbi:MAG: phytoene/squalene synthase family protein, partial [Planctomycetes bacterium]|nr:phytoene/squalene synthase family protein [Planctomycetota bacterium]
PAQFRSMCALYAYMRICDDIGDDESVPVEARREHLALWEGTVRTYLNSTSSVPSPFKGQETGQEALFETGLQVLPALRDVVERHSIPQQYLLDVIRGVGMDLDQPAASFDSSSLTCRYQTFDELRDYCYHVAGVVGLCCIHVWGFRNEGAIGRAVDCGLAFQLTNILRDLGEDADHGRIYLPAEDLDRFGYSPTDIKLRVNDDRFQALMEFQVARAEQYYEKARGLFQHLEPSGRTILKAMVRIYGGLLGEIRKRDYDVYSRHISLPTWQKMLIAADAMIRRRFQRKSGEISPEA